MSAVDSLVEAMMRLVNDFYKKHPEIKVSHGLEHVMRVYHHTCRAVLVHKPPLLPLQAAEIKIAALLHDVDDGKYFSHNHNYENARAIMKGCSALTPNNVEHILSMIGWVSCSKNGNRVPERVKETGNFYWLIPRWADRLEAVGAVGVVRCYQYNQEHNRPLFSASSPRATTEAQVWALATPDRFENYLRSDMPELLEDDMISHYYDKLLHIARPPPDIVRNEYLEAAAQESSRELVKVCLTFGQMGRVDVSAIEQLAYKLGMRIQ